MTGERLRMFPLGSVVFPGSVVPLRVFELRYRRLLDDVLALGCSFGTVLIERGVEVGGGDVRFDVGTRLRVLLHRLLPDGQRVVLVEGGERVRVTGWLPDDPHPWAVVAPFPDASDGGAPSLPTVVRRLQVALALASELGSDTAGLDLDVGGDLLTASYRASALAPLTPLDAYALLAAPGPGARLELLDEMLAVQIELLRLRLGGS